MNNALLSLYSGLWPLLFGAAKLFSPLHPRLRTFFSVREGSLATLEKNIAKVPSSQFRLWVHAASVGEFEQARPVIALLKEKHPDIALFVSFLSDSGYNARKNFPDAAAVFYLPADTRSNARKLLTLLKPDLLLLMRYDFWPNHLFEAKKRGVRLMLAAAVLQENSHYFNHLLKGFWQQIFHLFERIFTASAKDTVAFREKFGCLQAETAGDPRFDQVVLRSRNSSKVDHLKPFYENRTALCAGSVWQKDTELILDAWLEQEKRPALILVPHEVKPEQLQQLYEALQQRSIPSVPVSAIDASFDAGCQVLVIDQIGYLAELYSIASFAYVGGGFGVNVHNTLEPAVYGIPVIFGPRHHNSPEAEGLAEAGGATVVHDRESLTSILRFLTTDTAGRERIGRIAGKFVTERTGATAIIAGSIEQMLAEAKKCIFA
ncbi:MAG: glycosyltransferase N-terminal domain-containing protein [Chlorobiaceae bacterium]